MSTKLGFHYITRDDLFFSKIMGRGVYMDTGLLYNDPLDNSERELACKVFDNIITGERYFAKTISLTAPGEVQKHIRNTKKAISRDLVFWPRDVMEFRLERTDTVNFVEEFYSPLEDYRSKNEVRYAVLFSADDYRDSVTLGDYLLSIGEITYTNPKIQHIAIDLINSIVKLNNSGFLYLDINLEKIRVTHNGNIYFDYSTLIFNEFPNKIMYKHFYPIEFAQPALVREEIQEADIEMQNYMLNALLFYLFFDRYAYDGGLLDDYRNDTDERSHYRKFQKYHEIAIFIFDVVNKANRIGEIGEEEIIVERWNKAPEQMRAAFTQSLGQENALRKNVNGSVTPTAWLELFKSFGWYSKLS